MQSKIDLIHKRFGKLQVLCEAGSNKHRKARWLCHCDCGENVVVLGSSLRSGNTKSCGCLQRQSGFNHGHNSPKTGQISSTYHSWCSLKQRCLNPKATGYKDYGGRGIKVCGRWLSFENFLEDMGERPVGKTLDREDNDGNYEPDNCIWSTAKEQANNRRNKCHC